MTRSLGDARGQAKTLDQTPPTLKKVEGRGGEKTEGNSRGPKNHQKSIIYNTLYMV